MISIIVCGRIVIIFSIDAIILLVWIQMNIMVALNLWEDEIVNIIFYLFYKSYHLYNP